MALEVRDWWHCQPTPERATLNTILFAFQPPNYATSCALVDIAALGFGLVGDRRTAFDQMYRLTYTPGLPFPPPADCIVTGDPDFYAAIYAYIDANGSDQEPCQCPQMRQPGQQGGAWPECWP